MPKIAYNACYGGFTLSRKAILRGREISGDPKWLGATIIGDTYPDGSAVDSDFGHLPSDFPRHDSTLVAVIEELGDEASGMCAKLRLEELSSGSLYRIDEYDGFETVQMPDGYDWVKLP